MNLDLIRERRLKKSQFSFGYSSGNREFLFHSLLLNLVELSEEQKDILRVLRERDCLTRELIDQGPAKQRALEDLVKEGLVVASSTNEQEVFKNHFKSSLDVDFGLMYLLVTDLCNLGCLYCFVENPLPEDHKFTLMTPEVARQGIDLFARNVTKKPGIKKNICIYGGEPLMNRNVVHHAVNYIRGQYGDSGFSIQLITNGTLITDETAKILADNNVDVSVSIDGSPETTNHTRPSLDKKETFEKVRRGYEMLRGKGCKSLSISLTLSKYNVPNLRREVEYLVTEFAPTGFGFNFLLGRPCDLNGCEIPIEQATEQVIETFRYLREKGIPEDRMMRKVKAFVTQEPHLKDCGGVGNQIVVSSDGYVGPCQAFASSKKYFRPIGELQNLDLKKDPLFQEWGERYPLNLEDCLNCEAIGVCGGGCPYQSYLIARDIRKLDTRMCVHNKAVLNWMINETIK